MHTMEIAERADAASICARWFTSPVSKVSAHYCVDAGTVVQCVREKDVAWHARGGNTNSIGVELAGYAHQTTRDWEDDYSSAVLARAASVVADVCRRRRIPVRWLVAGDLVAGRHGITVARRGEPRVPKERPLGPGPRIPDRGVPRSGSRGAAGDASAPAARRLDRDPVDHPERRLPFAPASASQRDLGEPLWGVWIEAAGTGERHAKSCPGMTDRRGESSAGCGVGTGTR